MTIKTIEIELFQPHELSILKPAKGFTVITGSSRAGKTSFVRAVKRAIENKPRGDFLSWFADDDDENQVAIEFDDGSHIVRIQGSRVNSYIVSSLDKPLKAIRSDVPEEVSDITQMSSVNIQSQLDPYFMLQPPYTPGEIGRMFNEAVKLEIIDETTQETNTFIRKFTQSIGFMTEESNKLQEEVKQYKNLDEIQVLIQGIDLTVRESRELKHWIINASTLISDIERTDVRLKDVEAFLSVKGHLEPIRKLILETTELDREVQLIQSTLGMISLTEGRINKLDGWLEIKDPLDEILEIAENVSKLKSERTSIKSILRDIYNVENRLSTENDALEHRRKELSELLRSSQLKFCPFCKQPMSEEIIKHLEEHGV